MSAFGKLCAAPSSVCIADPCAGVVSSMVTTCVTNPNFAPTDAGTDPSVVLPVSASARG